MFIVLAQWFSVGMILPLLTLPKDICNIWGYFDCHSWWGVGGDCY